MLPSWLHSPHPELPRGHRFDGAGHTGTIPTPRPSTSPPGLWAPAPEVVVKPKQRAPRTPRVSTVKSVATRAPAREPAKCATDGGYKKHRREGTEVCAPCREAHRIKAREYTDNRPKTRKQYKRADCGTKAGYDAHRSRKERICDPCRLAHNTEQRDRLRKRLAAEGKSVQIREAEAKCGTASGYKRHRRNGETACTPCLDANRANNIAQRERKRAA